MEASLITMVVTVPSQIDVGWVKLKYCLKRISRSSSLVYSCVDSLLLVSFSLELVISMISFIMASGDFDSLGELSVLFFIL